METNSMSWTSWRFKVRFLFQVFLAIGFFLQSWEFLQMYWEYQCTVELEVEQPTQIEMPAFTVCNINEFRFNHFCESLRKKCGSQNSTSEDCTHFSEYCNNPNIKNVTNKIVSKFLTLSRYEQQVLGHQYKELVSSCFIQIDDRKYNCTEKPVLVPALSFRSAPFNCFMMYSLHKNPIAIPELIPVSLKILLELNLEVSEYQPSLTFHGAVLSIHSPYHVPSPVKEGIYLNMGSLYRLHVNLAEKSLLPPPFKSRCTDYLEPWKKNGGTGPTTEKMCKELCKLNISLRKYGCADKRIHYPHNETICPEKISTSISRDNEFRCAESCPSSCNTKTYELTVQEANLENKANCASAADSSCDTWVHIIFDNLEKTTFRYKARFEQIAFLSYIGGYVGLWLGISFLTVYDFLETRVFLIAKKGTRFFSKVTVTTNVKENKSRETHSHTLAKVHE